jgi:hypothetical protein
MNGLRRLQMEALDRELNFTLRRVDYFFDLSDCTPDRNLTYAQLHGPYANFQFPLTQTGTIGSRSVRAI